MAKPELNLPNDINMQTLGKRRSLLSIIIAKFFQNKLAVIGLILLTIIIGAAIFAPLITPHNPDFQNLRNRLAPPGAEFWLGTDHLGRDIFSRILYGGRVSLTVGFIAMVGAVSIGTTIGAVAGFFGGKVDAFFNATCRCSHFVSKYLPINNISSRIGTKHRQTNSCICIT